MSIESAVYYPMEYLSMVIIASQHILHANILFEHAMMNTAIEEQLYIIYQQYQH